MQAVDGARVGAAVELVHLPAEMRAPLGDADGERDVEGERAAGDGDERAVVAGGEDHRHQRDLDQRRQDREQRVADQRGDAARAALDVAGEAAGLPVEMEAQRQRVQVAEHGQRDRAHRALGHAHEQDLAQLGEHRGRQPQHAVRDEQRQRHHQDRELLVEVVDDVLEHDRHGDVRHLGGDEADHRGDHARLVAPQVRQQRADGPPVGAAHAARRGWRGRRRGRMAVMHRPSLAVPEPADSRRRGGDAAPAGARHRPRGWRATRRWICPRSTAWPTSRRQARRALQPASAPQRRATIRCRRSRESPSPRARCRTRPSTPPW